MTKAKVINKPGAAQQSQLARAFDVINALINATQPMKLKTLAEVTRLDASGTLRLLKTLVELGYVIRIESTKSYLPSVKALFPIGLYHPIQELRRDAAQLLIEIQQTCDVTSALQIFLGGQRVVIDQRHNSSRLTPFWNTTITSPLHSSASGKLYLSTLSLNERRKLLGGGSLERFTAATLTSFDDLETNIQASLEQGFFTAKEEAFSGMSSVAAPLRAPGGLVIGAMVATGNASQLQDKKLIECGQIVKRAADFLSQMSPNIRTLESLLGQN